MNEDDVIQWLLAGDISIQYQVHRDLLDSEGRVPQERIAKTGWAARFLSLRNQNGHWGRAFYSPKWTSTHYTLLDLKNLGVSPDINEIKQTLSLILENNKGPAGEIVTSQTSTVSDVCINGMFLNYASYFQVNEIDLHSIVDFILSQHMDDGGFNCLLNTKKGAIHSSLHSTISIIEGIREYEENGYKYRLKELRSVEQESREFILKHKLFRSDRTGEIINKKFLMLSYPFRWYYDILRALEYFRLARVSYDDRMQEAIDILIKKRRADHKWPLQARHPGQTHFEMEQPGRPSRWNTLRALRVLKHYS